MKLPNAYNRNYGHTLQGEQAIEFKRYMETANVTVNLLAYNSIDPTTNQPCLKAGDIIVMDNAPTHHNNGGQILREFLEDIGVELVYMPAYSPEFNPIEYVFGKLRTLTKHQFVEETYRNLKESLYLAIGSISAGDMAGYYRVTGYLNVSLK